jgi:hypothetical protein
MGSHFVAAHLPVRPAIFICSPTRESYSMADLTERLTGLQHRVLELRDFL